MEHNFQKLLYTTAEENQNINAILKDESIWMTQKSMAELFDCGIDNISIHLKNIYKEGELEEQRTIEKISIVQQEGNRQVNRPVTFYNLDAIISVGYRVNSKRATNFRIWATRVLRDYIQKGFALDDDRLKNLGGGNHWKELLDRIRDIRSSEKVLNNFVSGYFDIAELNAIEHRPMYMEDHVRQLDAVLSSTGRSILTNAGTVSHEQALAKAKEEYKKFQQNNLSPVEQDYISAIKELGKTAKENS